MLGAIRSLVFAIGVACLLIRALTNRSPLRLLAALGLGWLQLLWEGLSDAIAGFFGVVRRTDRSRIEPGERVVPETPDSWIPHQPLIVWWQDLVNAVLAQLAAPAPVRARTRIVGGPPPRFPDRIPVYEAIVENFGRSDRTPSAWHAVPWDVEDLVRIVNWAAKTGVAVRALGSSHSWSPLTAGAGNYAIGEIVAIDLRRLDHKAMVGKHLARYGAGVSLEVAMRFLDDCEPRRALPRSAAAGGVTIGGLLAIGGHGTGAGEGGEVPGATMSSLVQALEVVAWDPSTRSYQSRTLEPGDPEFSAVVASLGGALVTSATLRTVAPYDLRAIQRPFKLREYLHGPERARNSDDDEPPPTLARELAEGPRRLELLWLPDQGRARGRDKLRMVRRGWEKLPATEAARAEPPYWDFLLNWASADLDLAFRRALADARQRHAESLGRRFQTALWASTLARHRRFSSLSGQLYSTAMVVRYHAAGWCLVCERARLGELLDAAAEIAQRAQVERDRPLTGPIEVRITDLDTECGPGRAALSPARPPADTTDTTDFDALCTVWFSLLTDLRDPRPPEHEADGVHDRGPTDAGLALRTIEQWLLDTIGELGLRSVRPEWPKGFAYDAQGRPWSDTETLARYRRVYEVYDDASADDVADTLARLDPAGLFRNPLLRRLGLDAPAPPDAPGGLA